MRILAIDPGKAYGMALYSSDDARVIVATGKARGTTPKYRANLAQMVHWQAHLLGVGRRGSKDQSRPVDVLVYEDADFRPTTARATASGMGKTIGVFLGIIPHEIAFPVRAVSWKAKTKGGKGLPRQAIARNKLRKWGLETTDDGECALGLLDYYLEQESPDQGEIGQIEILRESFPGR